MNFARSDGREQIDVFRFCTRRTRKRKDFLANNVTGGQQNIVVTQLIGGLQNVVTVLKIAASFWVKYAQKSRIAAAKVVKPSDFRNAVGRADGNGGVSGLSRHYLLLDFINLAYVVEVKIRPPQYFDSKKSNSSKPTKVKAIYSWLRLKKNV